MPVLQNLLPSELEIDPTYQRSLDVGQSQALIRKIAQHWNWDLCQPLVVARRDNGDLFVIDGQHRLAAARLRGDIQQLPAVVLQYASVADEAASFVHLNQQRRPLTKLDVFKAAVASEDAEATAIVAAIHRAGLSIAPHSNYASWKPGMISNIGGIEASWRRFGPEVTYKALWVTHQAFKGQILQLAGTIFPAVAAVCAATKEMDEALARRFAAILSSRPQAEWRRLGMAVRANGEVGGYSESITFVIRKVWEKEVGKPGLDAAKPVQAAAPAPKPNPIPITRTPPPQFDAEGKAWCGQCDRRVTRAWAKSCISGHCSLKALK
jgi:ParB-like nuclease domain